MTGTIELQRLRQGLRNNLRFSRLMRALRLPTIREATHRELHEQRAQIRRLRTTQP